MAKNHSNSLDIPTQLSRRLRRFSDRSQPLLMMGKSETSRQCSKPARLAPTSTRDMYPTITTAPPVLTEKTFQQLLAAAHVMQECSDRRVEESKVGYTALSDGTIAKSAQPVQIVPRTPRAAEVPASDLAVDVISMARIKVEPLLPENDLMIPPETAYQLAVLASRLEALAQPQIRTDSGSTIRMPVATAWEKPVEEQQIEAGHVEIHEEATSEPARLIPLLRCAFPSGRSNSPHRIVRRRIFQSNELFWRTATIFTLAAVLFLLLGTSGHRIAPWHGRLSLPSEVVQRQAPFRRTTAMETSAMKTPAPTVVADQPPASGNISSSPQKAVVKPTELHSTYASDANIVAEQDTRLVSEVQNRIRADHRLQMTQVQVRASNGIVTLSGDVASDAERVATAQDAALVGGVEALVNRVRVITNSHLPTGPSAVVPVVSGSGAESSSASASTSAMETLADEQITVPYGTVLAVRLNETLSSGLNQPGDTFLARLASAIVIGDRVIVPEGAVVKGKIVDARNARRLSGRSALVIDVTHLAYNGRTYELRSSQYSKSGASRNAYAAAAITGGTGVGAILGTVLGRGRGAAIGAVLGAAAGTGVQAVTKPAPAEISAESALSLRLEGSLKVIPSSTLQQPQSAHPDLSQGHLSDDRPVLKQRPGPCSSCSERTGRIEAPNK